MHNIYPWKKEVPTAECVPPVGLHARGAPETALVGLTSQQPRSGPSKQVTKKLSLLVQRLLLYIYIILQGNFKYI